MNWSDSTKWESSTDGGASWNTAAAYPAQLFTDTVTIRTGHIVALDTTLVNTIDSLEIIGTLRIGNNAIVRSLAVGQLYITGTFSAGNNTAADVATGMYFYTIAFDNQTWSKK